MFCNKLLSSPNVFLTKPCSVVYLRPCTPTQVFSFTLVDEMSRSCCNSARNCSVYLCADKNKSIVFLPWQVQSKPTHPHSTERRSDQLIKVKTPVWADNRCVGALICIHPCQEIIHWTHVYINVTEKTLCNHCIYTHLQLLSFLWMLASRHTERVHI